MVQAARSGVQNIAEGSQASGTSKKTELKLTNVARASLEELLRFERKVKVEPEKLYQEIGIYCFGRGTFHKLPRTGME